MVVFQRIVLDTHPIFFHYILLKVVKVPGLPKKPPPPSPLLSITNEKSGTQPPFIYNIKTFRYIENSNVEFQKQVSHIWDNWKLTLNPLPAMELRHLVSDFGGGLLWYWIETSTGVSRK